MGVTDESPAPGSTLDIDHCHDTGAIRGVLCVRCNTAIGSLGDTPESLMKAVNYLRGQS